MSKDSLSNKYEAYIEGKCANGFVDGYRTRRGDKQCLHKETLPIEYDTHEQGKCAEGYVEGELIDYAWGYNYKTCFHRSKLK